MNRIRFQKIRIQGVDGWYAAAGPPGGAPILLLATPLAGIEGYRPTIECLSQMYRVHAVGLPGSGKADRLSRPWSLSDYAQWVAGLITELGLEDVTAIGHSESGGVVLLLSLVCPGRVARVVVADGIGVGAPHHFIKVFLGRVIDTLTCEFRLCLRNLYYLFSMLVHFRNYLHQVRLSLNSDLSPLARSIRVPVLLAWGELDHTLPKRCAWQFAQLIARPTVYISDDGSHCWPITHAHEFAEVVDSWVRTEAVKRSNQVGSAQ